MYSCPNNFLLLDGLFPPLLDVSVLVHAEAALVAGVALPVRSSLSSVAVPGLTLGEDRDGDGGNTRVLRTVATTIGSAVVHDVDLTQIFLDQLHFEGCFPKIPDYCDFRCNILLLQYESFWSCYWRI